MSKDAIFPDVDLDVHCRPAAEGLQLVVPCGVCGRQLNVVVSWGEVAAMLNGQPIPGIQPGHGGWVIEMRCVDACRDGLGNQNRVAFILKHAEVRNFFENEMARRRQSGVG